MVVPSLKLLDRMTELPTLIRDVQNHSRDGRADLRIAQFRIPLGNAVLYDFEVVLRVLQLLFGFGVFRFVLLELLLGDHAGVEQSLDAFEFLFGLSQVDPGHVDARFGCVQRSHIGDDFHFGDHFALTHRFAGLFVHFRDDPRYLRLDQHLVPGFDLARGDCPFFERVDVRFDDGVDLFDRPGLVPQEDECPDQQDQEQYAQRNFSELFSYRL